MIKLNWWKIACALSALWMAAAIAAPAQVLAALHSFDNTDGAHPLAALVQGTDGSLYGTTVDGGTNGYGSVFKITTSGTLTTLYNFCSQTGCMDGKYPEAGLVEDSNGSLYGTTDAGGPNNAGTVFKIIPSRALTTLYSFCSQSGCADGEYPEASLVQGADGSLYGTTDAGGARNAGTVFKISPSGALTTLYSFCSQTDCADGKYPEAALVQATSGTFYGTTVAGGANGDGGTVFKIGPDGPLTTLYSFCSQSDCADGKYPEAALVQDASGSLYGTTDAGGANDAGTVFRISPRGNLITLYSFCSQVNCVDGEYPEAPLVLGTDKILYGTTDAGGANGYGSLFGISLRGVLRTVYSFCNQGNCADGKYPGAALVQGTNGGFYGTTYSGGTNNVGTVFSLTVYLAQFVETLPTSGEVGIPVLILGTNLTRATSVTFNGTAAAFTVSKSGSYIKSTVPAGATTGPVQVVTPSGTLSSNMPFRVIP
jgi:uncharacterized repeat protein (TIGR03803 family)